MDTIAEETTTLGEGYTISVARMRRARPDKSLIEYTILTAYRGESSVTMRADDVGAYNLRQYLALMVKEIERQRARLTAKPTMLIRLPKNVEEFVRNMAYYGMFILVPWSEKPEEPAPIIEKKKRPKKRSKKKIGVKGNGDFPF